MPKKYMKIKESLLKQGRPAATAKRIAAATYNKERKPGQKPVTPGVYERSMMKRKGKR